MSGRLGPENRAAALQAMAAKNLDVLVVGGGVLGAGTALDAVSRGLSVGLVEMQDWASGMSSRSGKLIDGGLRDLERLDLAGVRSAALQRGLLVDRIAPHLVRRVPFLYPLTGHGGERAYAAAGLLLYDALARVPGERRVLPPHRQLTRRAVRRVAPALRMDGVTGGVQFYEAQVDDARLTLTCVRTAAAYGALVANRSQVTELVVTGERVAGARVLDLESGTTYPIGARVVISAAGVWTGELTALPTLEAPRVQVAARKRVHLVVPRNRIRSSSGMMVRNAGAVVRVVPWGRHWIIGATDTPWEPNGNRPTASRDDVDSLLDAVNQHLTRRIDLGDVEGCFAGLRPILPLATGRADGRSRPTVLPVAPGLVVAIGRRFSTYRVTAARAVDLAAKTLGGLVAESVTDRLPLLGADGFQARWNQRHLLARGAGLHVAQMEHLLSRYGSMVDEVLEVMATDAALRQPIPGAEDYLVAEAVYAVTHEDARDLTDILTRRTRIGFETWDRGAAAAPFVAACVAGRLGWDDATRNRQVEGYLHDVEAERASWTGSSPT